MPTSSPQLIIQKVNRPRPIGAPPGGAVPCIWIQIKSQGVGYEIPYYLLGVKVKASVPNYFMPGRMAQDLRNNTTTYRLGYRHELVPTGSGDSTNPEGLSGVQTSDVIYIMYSPNENQFHLANTKNGGALDVIIPINPACEHVTSVHIDVSLKVTSYDHIDLPFSKTITG